MAGRQPMTPYQESFNPLAPGSHILGNYHDNIVVRPGPLTANEQYLYHNVILDSRDRDPTKWPTSTEYVIEGGTLDFRDVVSIELIQLGLYKSTAPVQPDWIALNIVGISTNKGSSAVLDGSFAQVILADIEPGTYRRLNFADLGKCYTRFNPVRPHIIKFHIKFVQPDGTPYDFGGQENTIMLEIKSKFKTRDY